MSVYIPCLNVDRPDSGTGFSIGAFVNPQNVANAVAPQVLSSVLGDSGLSFYLGPIAALISFGVNFQFWKNLVGLGETRIEREKESIQDIFTAIFRYLNTSYGVPIRDNHALQFSSDGVRAQFAAHPDIAALVDYTSPNDQIVANYIFAHGTPTSGQEQRVSNQFLANAAINGWPVSATKQIWDGIVSAADPNCPNDPTRWMYNPEVVRTAAQLATLLQFIPLDVLNQYAARNALGTFISNNIIAQWANNPQLVSDIPRGKQTEWTDLYQTFLPGYFAYQDEFGNIIPLLGRPGIGALVNAVVVRGPVYPDFAPAGAQGIPSPGGDQPSNPPTTQPPTQEPPGQNPNPTPTPQPPPPPNPQPPTVIIPTDQDYSRACDIVRRMGARQDLTQAELDWMLTVVGAKAVSWAVNQPSCNTVPGTNPYDPTQPIDPNCPAYPTNPQTPEPVPLPQPQPTPQPPQGQTPCPPACQQQILQLQERIKQCCDRTEFIVIPELQFILEWLVDLERRVPGVPPALPPPPIPVPPPRNLDPVPPPEPPGNTPPGGIPEPPLPPDVIQCISVSCDGEVHLPPTDGSSVLVWAIKTLCECGAKARQKAKKLVLNACEFGILMWGKMAECWLNANTDGATLPIPVPPMFQSLNDVSNEMSTFILTANTTFFDRPVTYGTQIIEYGLGQPATLPDWPYEFTPIGQDWIFADPAEDPNVEIPVLEA